jgi:hypothetical protein
MSATSLRKKWSYAKLLIPHLKGRQLPCARANFWGKRRHLREAPKLQPLSLSAGRTMSWAKVMLCGEAAAWQG